MGEEEGDVEFDGDEQEDEVEPDRVVLVVVVGGVSF